MTYACHQCGEWELGTECLCSRCARTLRGPRLKTTRTIRERRRLAHRKPELTRQWEARERDRYTFLRRLMNGVGLDLPTVGIRPMEAINHLANHSAALPVPLQETLRQLLVVEELSPTKWLQRMRENPHPAIYRGSR